jgi:hypothetical protein
MTKTEVPHITVKGIIERGVVNGSERAQRLHRREREKQKAAWTESTEVKQESTTTVTRRPQTVRRVYHFIVAGSLSFLNNACGVHSNLYPCAWKSDDDTGDAVSGGDAQATDRSRGGVVDLLQRRQRNGPMPVLEV